MNDHMLSERLAACAADLSAWTSAEPDEVPDLLAEVARASALMEEAAFATGPAGIIVCYSVPGLPPHRGRTADIDDARGLAGEVAGKTGARAAILVHLARDGREVIGSG
jgi:hypothetical protein